jgi:hypothetical protein
MFSKEVLIKVALMVVAVVIGNILTGVVQNFIPKKTA